MPIFLRPECPADEPFLRRLIFETIALELGASAWPEPMRTHLLEMQYSGRRHPNCQGSRIIVADGRDAGWILASNLSHELRLVEIMVSPELRGRGIGTAAIREVLRQADESANPVRLTVNVSNMAAIRLYRRLGFFRIEGDAVQDVMERSLIRSSSL